MTMLKNIQKLKLAWLAIAALTVLGGCATATVSDHYKFEIVGQPSGSPLLIRLVDVATGQTVPTVEIFAVHIAYSPPKGVDQRETRIPLESDGHGDFLYPARGTYSGETLHLAALVAGMDSPVRGSVDVP